MPKILILGKDTDPSINKVISWLKYLDPEVVIHRSNQLFSLEEISLLEGEVISNYTSVWLRMATPALLAHESAVEQFFLHEKLACLEAILSKNYGGLKVIGNLKNNRLNKLEILFEAKSCGLNVPSFMVSSSKLELLKFMQQFHQGVITKSMTDPIRIDMDGARRANYSLTLHDNSIESWPDHFQPLFFQQRIQIKFEIRAFFLENESYAMGKIPENLNASDIRNKEETGVVRCFPVTLPDDILFKIQALMKKFELNTASVDLLVDESDNYCFIDFNPIGQFGDVEHHCNYPLSKVIASSLLKN